MADLKETVDKCASDPKDGYRRVDEEGRIRCTLLSPDYGDRKIVCIYQGSRFYVELKTPMGKEIRAFYYCGKPTEA